MAPPLLHLRDIALTFGGTPLLTGAELAVAPGERVCLVGRNGSGKSTLLKVAVGVVEPDSGERFVQPGATLRYLPQEPDMSGFETTLAYVEAGLAPGDETYRAQYLIEELGLTGREHPVRLSGGEARRAALARVLAPRPDVLLLDEPTNHLDLPAIEWLEGELASLRSALVLISHDRRFLETLSRATVWLDRGTTRRLDRGFDAFEAWRDQVFEEEERERHKLDRRIAMEEDWLRYGVTARRKRNVRRLGELHDLRRRAREHRGPTGVAAMQASEAEASGKIVIEATSVSKSFGDTAVVRNVSMRIARGDRIGIVGANGTGKTTLVRLITGALEPDEGTVRLGTNLSAVDLDQRRQSLDPDMTVADTLTGGRGDWVGEGEGRRHVIGYMKDFLFSPEQARTPASALSGGERGRLMLARALATPSNLMVLDEPTNDLDLETLDILEEMLGQYAGTVILVSHDRDFLDRVVTRVMAADGEGRWTGYAGGYSDMVAQRGHGVRVREGNGGRGTPARHRDAPKAAPRAPRAKLSFRDKHALDTLPRRIADIEKTVERHRAALADPHLFARDRAGFETLAASLQSAETQLAEAEEEWLRLEMLREEIENGG